MNLKLIGVGALAVAGALAFWRWEVVATERDAIEQNAEALQARLDEQAAELSQLTAALDGQRDRAARLVEVERGIQTLRQTLDAQGAAQRASFEELKRNDQAVRDYLHRGVPRTLGVRYQRPDTTNPADYRRAPGLPADPVPIAGPPGAGDE
ncbi:hypothetical protein [Halomonas sp. OfavH-34-E]|uniref:hypothetical protein n=1 Tax=Halomonas sp. OfavH-34-E TaxID=2954491 RepID=UPI002098171D|nr:hypothetical protein [Halomonas sp. OfavH-34-E]MCO7217141.1 hypothetical protein [Halomonas sp. OfavH-34-E]